ncbi:MAG TPA: hypothetical protein VK926_05825 [Gaiellaceae bacterium]|nr:hypothetical protein [Gaiellaceae bacterium]
MANRGHVGEGKTLKEAVEDFAGKKAEEALAGVRELTFEEGLQRFSDTWYPIRIEIQLRPHNQWVRAYRVTDGA